MPTDWRRLSAVAGLRVSGDEIVVSWPDGRKQRVLVDEKATTPEAVRAWSVVAKPSVLEEAAELVRGSSGESLRRQDAIALLAWERSRTSDLVGFKIDSRGRLIGESWVPTDGLGADEWEFYVRTLAWSCDRLEYLLTGDDSD